MGRQQYFWKGIHEPLTSKGIYEWNDGRKYAGEWKNNNMNGFGIYNWPGGRRYVGFYTNDQKQGYGTYCWSDGRKFEGWWYQNKQHGPGKYYVPTGIFASPEIMNRRAQAWTLGRWKKNRVVHQGTD